MLWKTPWVKGDDQIHHCKIENRRMSPEAFHKPMDPLKFFEIIYLNGKIVFSSIIYYASFLDFHILFNYTMNVEISKNYN